MELISEKEDKEKSERSSNRVDEVTLFLHQVVFLCEFLSWPNIYYVLEVLLCMFRLFVLIFNLQKLDLNEAQAREHFRSKFDEALANAWKTSVNWAFHSMAKKE